MSFQVEKIRGLKQAMLDGPTRDLVLNEKIKAVILSIDGDFLIGEPALRRLEDLLMTTVRIVNLQNRQIDDLREGKQQWDRVAATIGADPNDVDDVFAKVDEIACFRVALKGFPGIEK